jgi:hypothetical protein
VRPSRPVIAPGLQRWLEAAPAQERRTVVVRVGAGSDAGEVGARLAELGAEFEPPAEGAVLAAVTPAVLQEVARQPWVVSIDAPRLLFPRSPSA